MADQKWLSGRVNGYTPGTLENNWNEERFDIKYLKESKPLPSQYGHFYNTTYQDLCSNRPDLGFAAEDAVHSAKYRIPGFPGHQPEMDPEYYKQRINTYETDHRVNYLDPRLKTFPFDLKKMMTDEIKGKEEVYKVPAHLYMTDLPRTNATPAPIVQLDKVFSSEPEKRIFKTLSAPQFKKHNNEDGESDSEQQQQQYQHAHAQHQQVRPATTAVTSTKYHFAPHEKKPKSDEPELSNFEKLMMKMNKNKKGKNQDDSHYNFDPSYEQQQQQQQQQPVPVQVEEPIKEPPMLIATENVQREKTAKTVRWQDQNVDN